jgi:7-cyano-7-deazaguanine synthase
MSETAVLLSSGGLDSTTLAFQLRRDGVYVLPLFVDYGQHCAATEYATLQAVLPPEFVERTIRLDISDVYRGVSSRLIAEPNLWLDAVSHHDLYLPYRNLLLITVAAAFAQARQIPTVYAAFINSNHALEIDCSSIFFQELHKLLTTFGGVDVRMPFRDMSKLDVVMRGLALGAPIASTFSCQAQSEVPCGACPNCVDRLTALSAVP